LFHLKSRRLKRNPFFAAYIFFLSNLSCKRIFIGSEGIVSPGMVKDERDIRVKKEKNCGVDPGDYSGVICTQDRI
jgi:hypothetical protein